MTLQWSVLYVLFVTQTTPIFPQTSIDVNDSKHDSTDYYSVLRNKRVTTIIGSAVWRGVKATRGILNGATEYPSGKKLERWFRKSGNYKQAEKDFHSTMPSYVYPTPDGGMVGKIGDRHIALVPARYPQIRIAKPIEGSTPNTFLRTIIQYE